MMRYPRSLHSYGGPVLDDRVLLAGAFAGLTQELNRLGTDRPDAGVAKNAPGETLPPAVVTSVDPGSPAARAGARPGDIITAVNDAPPFTDGPRPRHRQGTRPAQGLTRHPQRPTTATRSPPGAGRIPATKGLRRGQGPRLPRIPGTGGRAVGQAVRRMA
jgi:hypothetical protein